MTLLGSLDNFYLTLGQLEASPSRADGFSAEDERTLRHYCCDVVAEACILLRLPQVVAATAQVLVQRFYCKRSLKRFDVKIVAMAAFWLACKLEEVIRIDDPQRLTLRSVITVVDRVARRREGRSLAVMDPYSQRYEELKMQAVVAERHMLRAFGFVLHVEHPHRFVLNYCQMVLFDTARHPESLKDQQRLAQEAWNMCNDSLRTSLCVRYKAEVVACGILFTAARKLKIPLPESPPWWTLFEVEDAQVYAVCAALCELYARPRPQPLTAAPATAETARARAGAQPAATVQSPLSGTPLATPPSAAPSAATGAAQPARSDGAAPSVAQQAAGSEKQQRSGGGAGEPSTAAAPNGAAPAVSEARKPAASGKCARSRSRSRSRSRDRKRGKERRGSRSRSRSRSRGRERGGGRDSRGGERRRSPSPRGEARGGPRRDSRGDRGRDSRDHRGDQQLYRPGTGRLPPRHEDRRREDYRDRDRGGRR